MSALVPALLLVGATATSTSTAPDASGARPPSGPWPVEIDWVRFASGEWLNDECIGMRRNTLTFDSDQVGQREWDFDDVTDLVLARPAIFIFTDRTKLKGFGRVTPERVIVRTPTGVAIRPREKLLQIVMGEDRESDRWQLRLSLGANVSAGNSEQLGSNGDVRTIRRGDGTRLELQYVGAFARAVVQEQAETTVSNHRGNYAYEWYYTAQLFWGIVGGHVMYDELQGIAIKAQPGSLLGWQALDGDIWALSLGVGAGYQHTSFIKDVPSINTGGVVATVDLGWTPPGAFETALSSSVFADLGIENENNQSTLYNRLDLLVDITSIFDFNVTFIHRFLADPQGLNPSTGEAPVSNDFQLSVGIGATIN